MFEMKFADGLVRGMTCDGHKPVYVTKLGSQIMPGDWKRYRRAMDEMPDLPQPAKRKGAHDDESLREFFRRKGLRNEEVERAMELVRQHREAEAKDKLPVNALHGGYAGHLSGRSKNDVGSFERRFPEVARVTGTVGHSQFDDDAQQHGRTARDRKIATDAAAGAEARLLKRFGPSGPARIGRGMWPARS
jgi:hypothetical protein